MSSSVLLPAMHDSATLKVPDDSLNVFGQQPGLFRLYTQLCLVYPVANALVHPAIIRTLKNGLQRLSKSFPWLAGQVIQKNTIEGSTGIFKLVPLDKTPRLVVKDLRNDPSTPTMDALRRSKFPVSMLDENIIAPRNTLSANSVGPADVFILQANFIIGGLLLTIVSQHNVMDMTGQGRIMDLLSKACQYETFKCEELSFRELNHRNIIPLLDDSWKPGSEFAHQIVKPTPFPPKSSSTTDQAVLSALPKCSWAYFSFSSHSLTVLKTIATKSITHASGYISTDDALSALIWQSVMRARLPRLDPAYKITLARAVDARRYIGIPESYPGLVQNMVYHTYTLQNLLEQSLGAIASQLRMAVDPQTSHLGYHTSALATMLDRAPDKSTVSVTAAIDPTKDILLSSWAKEKSYELDFNLRLGNPEAVRRPRFITVESLFYLMPKALDGEVVAMLCLRDEDMERLKADELFSEYSKYIG